jgi:membrane protein implicated in regulation of membrane protease activity
MPIQLAIRAKTLWLTRRGGFLAKLLAVLLGEAIKSVFLVAFLGSINFQTPPMFYFHSPWPLVIIFLLVGLVCAICWEVFEGRSNTQRREFEQRAEERENSSRCAR